MYFIEIKDDKIIMKGNGKFKKENQTEITEEIFNSITNLPSSYVVENEEIISVIPDEKPKLTAKEQRKLAYSNDKIILWENEMTTVNQANLICSNYLIENTEYAISKVNSIRPIIAEAKENIRIQYPD